MSSGHILRDAALRAAPQDEVELHRANAETHPRSLRGLYGWLSRHFCIRASSSASLPSGSMMRVVKYRSPEPPPAFGRPLPFRRKVRPLEVFFGIDSSTALPNVGTRTLAPSTASYSVIGSSTRRSLPSTLKNA